MQALRQDFGPWRQLTGQLTDSPALLLLQSGGSYASERWTVPSTATWWTADIGGNVTSVKDTGGRAAITDADGVGYTVGINQAFIKEQLNWFFIMRPYMMASIRPYVLTAAAEHHVRQGAAGVGAHVDHAAHVRHLHGVIERGDVLVQYRIDAASAFRQLRDHDGNAD